MQSPGKERILYCIYSEMHRDRANGVYFLRAEALQPETWAQILLCCLLTMQLWIDYMYSLCLSLVICKMLIKSVDSLQDFEEEPMS